MTALYNYGLCSHCKLPACGHAGNGQCPEDFQSLDDERKLPVSRWNLIVAPARKLYQMAKESHRRARQFERKNLASVEQVEAAEAAQIAVRKLLEATVADADERCRASSFGA